ncbi:hypothetical protein [Mucilaginibacter celer]|uniref:Uncharacterized protein n=1 Tax=Mucilaginibacter celer TaxID=2305508 RepID=A0A494VR41_9SPHI|nr:hypothetical protein [Mucilaginibacter celer]AYL95820.1 hypothetical protein HYN43_011205 [Mucilaginibacter celer]
MEIENTLTNLTPSCDKINRVMGLQKITKADIEGFNEAERESLGDITNQALKHLKGEERDDFLNKIEPIITPATNEQIWEYNHLVIGRAIAKLMGQYGSMPTKYAIAYETGLSRQTVAKHLTGYKTHPQYLAEMEQFKYMVPKILATICKLAYDGDIRAARLYFEIVGATNQQQTKTVINEQNNNYIQINNTILSQENLNRLSKEQLYQIERIVREK